MITAATLRDKDACADAITAFRAVYPNGLAPADWTQDEQLRALHTPLRRFLGELVWLSIVPMWTMRYADLAGVELSGSDLSGANLAHANLGSTDLRGVNLTRADLRGASLAHAALAGADLTGALRHRVDLPIPGWTVVDGRLTRETAP